MFNQHLTQSIVYMKWECHSFCRYLIINQSVDLMMALEFFAVYPLGTLNVCTKFHGNPSCGCRDISITNKHCQPDRGIRGTVRESPKSLVVREA